LNPTNLLGSFCTKPDNKEKGVDENQNASRESPSNDPTIMIHTQSTNHAYAASQTECEDEDEVAEG